MKYIACELTHKFGRRTEQAVFERSTFDVADTFKRLFAHLQPFLIVRVCVFALQEIVRARLSAVVRLNGWCLKRSAATKLVIACN